MCTVLQLQAGGRRGCWPRVQGLAPEEEADLQRLPGCQGVGWGWEPSSGKGWRQPPLPAPCVLWGAWPTRTATGRAVLHSGSSRAPGQVSTCMKSTLILRLTVLLMTCHCFSGSSRLEGCYPHFSRGRELCRVQAGCFEGNF